MSIVTLAVDVLNMLTRMEYELVGDELHRMLGAIVNLPPPLFVSATDAVQGLLSNLLDYHPKTRTFLPVLAHDVMFSSLSSHLSLLARALRMALTPTQSAELGPVILEELRCQSDILGGDEVEELSCVVRDESTKPELVLEIIRMLFLQVSQTRGSQRAQASTIVKTSIDILTRNFSPQGRWCDSSAALTQENLGVALLHVLVDRWLGVMEFFDYSRLVFHSKLCSSVIFSTVAPEEVLHKFAPLLFSIPLEPPFETTEEFDSRPSSHCDIFPYNILLLALRNAQFWELRNI
ncbi:hypothetical protein F5141DRAFT_1209556 [Pisolithus sp. B1]|nr:hypothetical protein F5141DRAFT_1209556 [Pisolithus sp. B1]